MSITAKSYKKSELFGPDSITVLSILESRKKQPGCHELISGGLQSRTTPKRIGLCRKASSSKEDFGNPLH